MASDVTARNRAARARGKAQIRGAIDAVDRGALAGAREFAPLGAEAINTLISSPIVPPRSLPGNPPHRETGRLSGNPPEGNKKTGYQAKVKGRKFERIIETFSTTFYAAYLEAGTRKMAPRPHVFPTQIRSATLLLRPILIERIIAAQIANRGKAELTSTNEDL